MPSTSMEELRTPRMTIPTQLVLRALLADPGRELYGVEIGVAAGLPSVGGGLLPPAGPM
jgi:hypothetical protein